MDAAEIARIQTITTVVVTIANVFLVLLTSLYVYLTRQMVREMKASHDPSVFIDLEFPDQEGRISIGNSGQSSATNIKFNKVKDSIPWRKLGSRPTGVEALDVMRKGVSYLPPGRTLKFFAGIPEWKQVGEQPCLLEIQVSYENEDGKKFKREYIIDFAQYNGILFESFRDPNLEVAKAIRDSEQSQRGRFQAEQTLSVLNAGSVKRCPMCAELIPRAAKKCSHCGETIADASQSN